MKFKDKFSRLNALYEKGGFQEVLRGIRDFIKYRSAEIRYGLRKRLLRVRYGESTIKRNVNGFEMLLDLSDPGISSDLALEGIREPIITKNYEEALNDLQAQTDETIVVDIGANIGYTVLTGDKILKGDYTIFAIEPVPVNVELLEQNINLNSSENIVVDSLAIGSEKGTKSLELSNHSNLHTFSDAEIPKSGETIQVDVLPLDEFLRQNDVSPGSVNCIRLDVEGFEYEVLQSAIEILSRESPFVLQMEFHNKLLAKDEADWIINTLKNNNFNIKCIEHTGEEVTEPDWDILYQGKTLGLVATRGI